MSIVDAITNACVQTAVYWGSPVNDGMGGKTFVNPVEILCRWESVKQVVLDAKGNEITSRALVYTLQDLEEEGMLFLGTLDDLLESSGDSSGVYYNPEDMSDAYTIKRFEKIPALGSTTEFLRKAYLTPQLSFGGF